MTWKTNIYKYITAKIYRIAWKVEALSKSVFDNVVAGAFQIAFRAEMHANDVFLFFKNHF